MADGGGGTTLRAVCPLCTFPCHQKSPPWQQKCCIKADRRGLLVVSRSRVAPCPQPLGWRGEGARGVTMAAGRDREGAAAAQRRRKGRGGGGGGGGSSGLHPTPGIGAAPSSRRRAAYIPTSLFWVRPRPLPVAVANGARVTPSGRAADCTERGIGPREHRGTCWKPPGHGDAPGAQPAAGTRAKQVGPSPAQLISGTEVDGADGSPEGL